MKRWLAWVVCCAVLVGLTGESTAQFARTEDAIKYRQSVMFLIGQHFGRIAAVVQGREAYDKASLENNAVLVATFAQLPWDAFMVPGSDSGTAMRSAALTDQAGFKTAGERSGDEIEKLARVAADGDLDAIRAQFGAVGQSCKACHDAYRGR